MNERTRPADQWNEENTPWIEEDPGVPARYRVGSTSRPEGWNVVDLTDRGGLGSCSCEDFQIRANPNYRRHGKHIPWAPNREGRSDCRHLYVAKEHFYQTVIVPMLRTFRDGIPSPTPPPP